MGVSVEKGEGWGASCYEARRKGTKEEERGREVSERKRFRV